LVDDERKEYGGNQQRCVNHIRKVTAGSEILISSKPTGTLVLRDLRPGRRLFLLATGTGIAPFLSIIKDPATHEAFEQVIVAHGVRVRSDLAYANSVITALQEHPDLGEIMRPKLMTYDCISREPCAHPGRITTALASGRLCTDLGIAPLNSRTDRIMICGNMDMLAQTRKHLDSAGFAVSPQIGVCGDYVIERAFTESFERKAA
jgi:ferredoxin/flavodoxin---NADP+ reductase